ncbi:PucR family transcriptional regulator [Metabacillus herbersteinensis]|uniref:PucR family transcriptional regulator n=1 Tax=Metabacillus herbersteinensis TaxID=283816 RepID=A0ABV6GGX3_9BACI
MIKAEKVIILGLTLTKALTIPPLDRCTVVAGVRGLSRQISSVNSYDAPDVLTWLKPGDFVLTTGYIFNDKSELIALVDSLAKRKCSGLAIKISRLPKAMLEAANKLDLPIIEIPDDLSISDLLVPILRQVLIDQGQQHELDKKNAFLKRLINREMKSEGAIFAEGGVLGLLPAEGYLCLCITPSTLGNYSMTNFARLLKKIEVTGRNIGVHLFSGEFENKLLVILQSADGKHISQTCHTASEIADMLINSLNDEVLGFHLQVGIGTYQTTIVQLFRSLQEAYQALQVGNRLAPKQNVFDYSTLQTYTVLQHTPLDISKNFVKSVLGPLIEYDKKTNSELVNTLEVYLECCLSPTDTARRLGIHRNTVHFRITRIKELLNIDLDNGKVLFQLDLAIRMNYLLHTSPK